MKGKIETLMNINKTIIYIILTAIIFNLSCASRGLVSEKYDTAFYEVPKLLPDTKFESNQPFILYSDNQAGFRVYHMALNKHRWSSPWMFAIPFYQLYLLGNGLVGSVNYFRHKPDYGQKSRLMVRDAIYDAAKESNAAFILNVGDITAHDGRRPENWKVFLDDYNKDHPILKEIPYFPVPGNHDRTNDTTYGWPNYKAIFGFPRFYTIEFPDAVIIILDSNFIIDQADELDNNYQDQLFSEWFVSDNLDTQSWLEKQFDEYSEKSFKLIAMHHSPLSYAHHHDDWFQEKNGNDLIGKRRKLVDLFENNNVDLVFSGHEHIYQHNLLKTTESDIHFIIGGGGGAPLRDPSSVKQIELYSKQFNSEGYNTEILKQEKIFHYYEINFDRLKLIVDVYEVTGNDDEPRRLADKIIIENKTLDNMNEVK